MKKLKYFLFLDDRRTLEMAMKEDPFFLSFLRNSNCNLNDIKIAKNKKEFVNIVNEFGIPNYISFDHDLADWDYKDGQKIENTGDTCAKYLCQLCYDHNMKLPIYYVHSNNPAGKKNIKTTFEFYRKHIIYDPIFKNRQNKI